MNNRVNYTFVGFLVIISISMMLWFSYWLLKPSKVEEMQKYFIYFDESVLGLNLDAPVKFRGISVGRVTRLRINPKNTQQVEVLIDILKTTPIKSSTVAKLTSQGITGLSYINLSLGDNSADFIKAKEGDEYPIIKTIPSLFMKLEDSFGSVSENLSKTLSRTQQLLDDENQIEISLLLKNSALFMSKMNKILDAKTINNFQETIKNLNSSSKKLDEMIPRIGALADKSAKWEDDMFKTFNSIMNSYLGIRGTMDLFKESLQSGDFNIKEISSDIVPTMNNTLLGMQELIIKIQEAVDKYNRSPSDMIFMKEQIKKGPGED